MLALAHNSTGVAQLSAVRSNVWFVKLIIAFCCWGTLSGSVNAHGLAIDVILADDQLQPFEIRGVPVFAPAVLAFDDSRRITSDSPGIGVANAANGIPPSTFLGLDVVSELGYFNGTKVLPTGAQLEVVSPSGVESYLIDSASEPQHGMTFGKYDGSRFWEAHGLFNLNPITADPGIYGAMVQITSPSYETSDPFLLPLVYDPANNFRTSTVDLAIALLTESLTGESISLDPNDLNADGDVDVNDVNGLCIAVASESRAAALGSEAFARFDVDVDGSLTQDDVQQWLLEMGALPGDTDLSGTVEFSDFLRFARNFQGEGEGDVIWSNGDFDCDGQIAFPDFLLLSANFGQSTAAAVHSVPEPHWQLGLLLPVVTLFRRRRRSSN